MLVIKTYFCKQAQLSFNYQVEIDGVATTHSFALGGNNCCEVIDPIKQKAIEESKYFASGWLVVKSEREPNSSEIYTYEKNKLKEKKIIDLSLNSPEKAQVVQETAQMKVVDTKIVDANAELDKEVEKELSESNAASFVEVTTIQQARDILRAEPYNIPFQSITTPNGILKKAEELGISFPNLTV